MKQTLQVMRRTTNRVRSNSVEDVINSLENDSINLFKRFASNQMKPNKDKCHLLISGRENININIDGNITEKSNCEKLLGMIVDYKLKFNKQLHSI